MIETPKACSWTVRGTQLVLGKSGTLERVSGLPPDDGAGGSSGAGASKKKSRRLPDQFSKQYFEWQMFYNVGDEVIHFPGEGQVNVERLGLCIYRSFLNSTFRL